MKKTLQKRKQGEWKEHLRTPDAKEFDGELLIELGYGSDNNW